MKNRNILNAVNQVIMKKRISTSSTVELRPLNHGFYKKNISVKKDFN